jgi:phosphatidylglycerophosphate synthase
MTPIAASKYKVSPTREEPLDRYLFRPIAQWIVPVCVTLKIHPILITLLAGITGLTASLLYFFQLTPLFLIVGFMLLAIVLDCLDGQVARARQLTSSFGRFLDGFMDYLIMFTWYIVLCLVLMEPYGIMIWILGVFSGISHFVQGILWEGYQQHPHTTSYSNQKSSRFPLIQGILQRYESLGRNLARIWQIHKHGSHQIPLPTRLFLPLLGHTSHLVALMIAVIIEQPVFFLLWTGMVLNLVVVGMLIIQFKNVKQK